MGTKHLYSVECRDPQGGSHIEHTVMTNEEAKELMSKFLREGVSATIYQLSGSVNLSHELRRDRGLEDAD